MSHARRLIVKALQDGFERAGREAGMEGSPEAVATQAAAEVAFQMIKGGRGDEVLKLYVLAAPAAEAPGEGGSKSLLMQALERIGVPAESLDSDNQDEELDGTRPEALPPGDGKSDGGGSESPGLVIEQPQAELLPRSPLELAGPRGAYGGRAGRPPHPGTPPAPPARSIPLGDKNFESDRAEASA